MASNAPYTLQDLMNRINTLVNNDADTPSSTDDEWEILLNLINQSIGKYESSDVFWDELWTSYTHASTIAAGDTDYTLTMTDLRYPGGFVKLTLNGSTNWVEVISPEEYQRYRQETRAVYFTGNASTGWVLNLCWTPATGDGTVGATITIPYYKFATRFTTSSATTDKPEMSDPNFIVYDVAATKSLLESKNNQFSVFSANASDAMDTMRTMNDIKPNYQNNNIDDVDALSFGSVMGE